jgi:hypothetical protein
MPGTESFTEKYVRQIPYLIEVHQKAIDLLKAHGYEYSPILTLQAEIDKLAEFERSYNVPSAI